MDRMFCSVSDAVGEVRLFVMRVLMTGFTGRGSDLYSCFPVKMDGQVCLVVSDSSDHTVGEMRLFVMRVLMTGFTGRQDSQEEIQTCKSCFPVFL